MVKLLVRLCLAFFIIGISGCITVNMKEQPPKQPDSEVVEIRMALVREMKEFQARLGWAPTDNFLTYAPTLGTYSWCMQSGILNFQVEWSFEITKAECVASGEFFDTQFYEAEALAGIGTPLSSSMVKARRERFIMVVFHEDFHEQVRGIPTLALNESAAELLGFLAARAFVEEKEGKHSPLYRELSADLEVSLKSASVEIRHYAALSGVYEKAAAGMITREQALGEKAVLYKKLQNECANMRLSTAMSCAGITNNASFARNIVYSAHYPLFYDLYRVCGEDIKKTGDIIIGLVKKELTEKEFVRRVEVLIASGCGSE